MKKIILIFFSITIFSSACPGINHCANEYRNNVDYRNKCFENYLKGILKPFNLNIELTTLSSDKVSFSRNRQKNLWQIATLKTKKGAYRYIEKHKKTLNSYSITDIYIDTINKNTYRIMGYSYFKDKRQEDYFIRKYAPLRRDTYSNPQPKIRDTYSNSQASITHNLNTMCTDLEKNYNKFNRRPNVELRIINRAKRELEECKRNRQDLINFQRR